MLYLHFYRYDGDTRIPIVNTSSYVVPRENNWVRLYMLEHDLCGIVSEVIWNYECFDRDSAGYVEIVLDENSIDIQQIDDAEIEYRKMIREKEDRKLIRKLEPRKIRVAKRQLSGA